MDIDDLYIPEAHRTFQYIYLDLSGMRPWWWYVLYSRCQEFQGLDAEVLRP